MVDNDLDRDGGAVAVGCLLILIMLPVNTVARGYTLHVLWGWFITVLFSVPAPSVAGCLGLSLVLGVFHNVPVQKDDASILETGIKCVVVPIAQCGFALLVGLIIKLFL